MISSIQAAARYLAEINKDRFSSFVMRRSDLLGLNVNTSLTFSIAGDSTVLSHPCGRLHTVPCIRNLLTRRVTCLRFTLSAFGNFFAKFINNISVRFQIFFHNENVLRYCQNHFLSLILRISFKTELIELKK